MRREGIGSKAVLFTAVVEEERDPGITLVIISIPTRRSLTVPGVRLWFSGIAPTTLRDGSVASILHGQ